MKISHFLEGIHYIFSYPIIADAVYETIPFAENRKQKNAWCPRVSEY